MKLITYLKNNQEQLAVVHGNHLHDLNSLCADLPATMAAFLHTWESSYPKALDAYLKLQENENIATPMSEVTLLAPVPHPTSCRDGYAFRQHVAAARRNRKVDMIPEFDQYPIFYFTNHQSVQGPGEVKCMPDHFQKLDFELEAAIVVCKKGRNIKAGYADAYIGGLMIMNDMSARTLQMEEMLLNLGPGAISHSS